MRFPRSVPALAIATAFAALPIVVASCGEPTASERRAVPQQPNPTCDPQMPLPPSDSTCSIGGGGTAGSGNRFCC
jgi:hypothetical protein